MPDIDGYPTKRELKLIKKLDFTSEHPKFEPMIEHLESIWHFADWGFHRRGRYFNIHTGGWSGNEEIISVLQKTWFWFFCWKKSIRGGHYWFEVPKNMKEVSNGKR